MINIQEGVLLIIHKKKTNFKTNQNEKTYIYTRFLEAPFITKACIWEKKKNNISMFIHIKDKLNNA